MLYSMRHRRLLFPFFGWFDNTSISVGYEVGNPPRHVNWVIILCPQATSGYPRNFASGARRPTVFMIDVMKCETLTV